MSEDYIVAWKCAFSDVSFVFQRKKSFKLPPNIKQLTIFKYILISC